MEAKEVKATQRENPQARISNGQKKGESNYLPNLPKGHDETSLENARMVLVEEMKKKQPNGNLILI